MFGGFSFKIASLTDFSQKVYDNTDKFFFYMLLLFHIVIYILGYFRINISTYVYLNICMYKCENQHGFSTQRFALAF